MKRLFNIAFVLLLIVIFALSVQADAYFSLNEGSGQTVNDSHHVITGTLGVNDGVSFDDPSWVFGFMNDGLYFDGNSDFVRIPNSPAINFSGSALTISAWVYPNAAKEQNIVHKDGHFTLKLTTNLGLDWASNASLWAWKGEKAAGLIPLGTWTHVVVVFNGATVDIYLNGTYVDSWVDVGVLKPTLWPLEIGAYQTAEATNYFNGAIDEIRLIGSVLNASEVLALYHIQPVCGDASHDYPEECDDGNTDNDDLCLNNCSLSYCGDGVVQVPNGYWEYEVCDDGNTNDNDSCKNDCTVNVPTTYCGDGVVQYPNGNGQYETCDDGNTNDNDSCKNDCTCQDTDSDGVCDDVDECANTNSYPVNKNGCSIEQFCGQFICGDSCDYANFRGHDECSHGDSIEEFNHIGYDCMTVIVSNQGQIHPECVPRYNWCVENPN